MLWKQICIEINRVKLANDEATGHTEKEDDTQKIKWEQHAANHEKRKMQQMHEQHGGVDLEIVELFEVMVTGSIHSRIASITSNNCIHHFSRCWY